MLFWVKAAKERAAEKESILERKRCLEIWAARYMYFQNMESETMSIKE